MPKLVFAQKTNCIFGSKLGLKIDTEKGHQLLYKIPYRNIVWNSNLKLFESNLAKASTQNFLEQKFKNNLARGFM